MPTLRAAPATVLAVAFVLASCHSGYRPLQVADACHCAPTQYCHVRAGSSGECRPLPAACGGSPSCSCVGRHVDACREELGAITLIEPRPVDRCDACSDEEYCWQQGDGGPLCRVLPARCDDTRTCGCLLDFYHSTIACDQRTGRIEAGPISSVPR